MRPSLDLGALRLRAVAGDGPLWRWRAEWYPPGQGGQLATRSMGPRCTQAEALRRAAELLEAGAHLAGGPTSEPEAHAVVTVRDLLEVWMGAQLARADLRPSSQEMYRVSARRIVAVAGDLPLAGASLAREESLRDQLLAKYAPQTVKTAMIAMGAAWRWGEAAGLIEARPPKPTVQVPRKLRRTPTAEEVAAVIAAATGWEALALQVGWSTGARVGELAAIRWEDVDLPGRVLRLDGKTGPREVPLVGAGLRALQAVPEGQRRGLVAAPRTAAQAKQRLVVTLPRLCAAAGVPPFTVHGLRRLAVDAMMRAGVDVATAAAVTGHSPAVMLTHYRQVTADDRLEAVSAAQLGELPGASPPAAGGKRRALR
jgi:integrase